MKLMKIFDLQGDVNYQMCIIAPSEAPKSVLARLNEEEMASLNDWMRSQATVDGEIDIMKWPGWGDHVCRVLRKPAIEIEAPKT